MAKSKEPRPVVGTDVPAKYFTILQRIKDDVQASQSRAVQSVNRELVRLYWRMGKVINDELDKAEWGRGVVERLSADLKSAFPSMRGFSPVNLWCMRRFYLTWTATARDFQKVQEGLASLPAMPTAMNLPALDKTDEPDVIIQQLVEELPWGHNLILFQRLKDPALRLWYLYRCVANGWSRNILAMQIDTALHARQGKAVTNFAVKLPLPTSDLAIETMKDPYNFDFLGLTEKAGERDIETQMLKHLKRFLLELGEGFAFVGDQYRLTVGDRDYYADALFYHIHLKAYVVVELKATPFEPAYVGQLNHYLSAVDDILRREGDNPTIGILLCRNKNAVDVEYALRGTSQPMAIADYHLTKAIPQDLKGALPSIEDIESEMRDALI